MSTNDMMPMVILRADSSATLGGGHVMRCLALADEVARRGGLCAFVAAEISGLLSDIIVRRGHRLYRIEPPKALAEEPDANDVLSSDLQERQAAETAAIAESIGATHLVVDHYRLDRRFTLRQGIHRLRTLVIDDLANRPLHCNLLLDQTAGRSARDYRELVSGADMLIGAAYALLRPQFAAARSAALRRRARPVTVERILITLGSTDLGGITGLVLGAVVDSGYRGAIDVVLDSSAPSRKVVDRIATTNPNIVVHANIENMAELMVMADLAIGAAGTTTWERCALGLPTLTLVLADNQAFVADQITAIGAALRVTRVADLGHLIKHVERNERLGSMSAASFAVVDGHGTQRVVDALLATGTVQAGHDSVALRRITSEDSEILWLWRNDPETRRRSRSHAPITRRQHDEWFDKILQSRSCIWIAEQNGRPVAMTRIDQTDSDPVVSIVVSPEVRGAGLGRTVLSLTCDRWDASSRRRLTAVIHDANIASIKAFNHCGFRLLNEAVDKGFRTYARTLDKVLI